MSRFFESRQKKEKKLSPFFVNGSTLQEELISTFNGRQDIPIRSFTAKQLITATNNFAYQVAEAERCNIYRGSINEHQVLVKKFDEIKGYSSFWTSEYFIRDIAITSQMSQLKNVLKLSGCCLEFKYPALVYEYVEYKTLFSLLHDSETSLAWKSRIQIAIGIANALLYLHTAFQTPIIHRDLKANNVIIDQQGVAKLTDFSFSITLPRGESRVEDNVKGTFGYLDPEYSESGYVTQKSDVYSFGVILLELVTGEKCFSGVHDISLVDHVKDCLQKNELNQIIDPKFVNQGFDQQQWSAMLNLGMKCVYKRGEDKPEMIQVARELRQIDRGNNGAM